MNTTEPRKPLSCRLLQLPQDRPCVGLLLLLAIFISGGLTAWGIMAILHPDIVSKRGRSIEEYRDRMTKELAVDLDLDSDQTEKVREIVQQQMDYYIEISKIIEPQKELSMEVFRRDVHALLDDDQHDKWEEAWGKLYTRWLRKPPPPPPPPGSVPAVRPPA
jgi:hypothetical protein